MSNAIDQIIHDVIQREGGYCNKPDDKGGPTNFGITVGTLSTWRGKHCTADDVKALSQAEAYEIYRRRYVEAPGFDHLADPYLQELIVDAGVNHGTHKATQLLQRALGVPDDGVLGIQTLKALGAENPACVWFRFMAARLKYYGDIIRHDDEHGDGRQGRVFGEGWLRRMINIFSQHSAEVVLANNGAKTLESTTALNLAEHFHQFAQQIHKNHGQGSMAYFYRAANEAGAASNKFRK